MAFTLRQFDTAKEMVDYLNDVVLSKPLQGTIYGLHGLTLIIDAGSGAQTVTFADASGAGLSLQDIVTQIEAAHASLVGVTGFRQYRPTTPHTRQMVFAGAGHVIDKDGTANSAFGFNTAADSTVGASAVALADIASITTDEGGNKFTVVHQ